jgi:hypothetical protein
MTNSPSGKAIEAFARDAGGSLTPAGTYRAGAPCLPSTPAAARSAKIADGLAQIVGHRISNDASLSQVTTVPVAAGADGIGVS